MRSFSSIVKVFTFAFSILSCVKNSIAVHDTSKSNPQFGTSSSLLSPRTTANIVAARACFSVGAFAATYLNRPSRAAARSATPSTIGLRKTSPFADSNDLHRQSSTILMSDSGFGLTGKVVELSGISKPKGEEDFLNGLVSGAVTRTTKEILLHPLDTIRARLQVAPANGSVEGIFDNLYDGLVPALVGGIPAGAVFFGVKDYSKRALKRSGIGKAEATVLSVAAANIPYWLIRTPSEVLKTLEQVQSNTNTTTTAANTLELFQSLTRNSGGTLPAVQGLYGSYVSNYVTAYPADVIKFYAYEALTESLFGRDRDKGQKIEGAQAAVTGALAGLIAQAATTPLDVARTRIMARTPVVGEEEEGGTKEGGTSTNRQEEEEGERSRGGGGARGQQKGAGREPPGEERGGCGREAEGEGRIERRSRPLNTDPFVEIADIVEYEGVQTLFKGLTPKMARALASGALQFASYELTQNALTK